MKNSYSAGGIGVLGVKKTTDGIWLYFAHNTDSFVSLGTPIEACDHADNGGSPRVHTD